MNSSTPPITKIFYLALASLTLLAAAVQWLPDEGFPPDIDLGAGEARAQAPLSAMTAPAATAPVGEAAAANYPVTPYVPQPLVYPTTAQPGAAPPVAAPVAPPPPGNGAAPFFAPPPSVPYAAPQQPGFAPPPLDPNQAVFPTNGVSPQFVVEPPPQELEAARVIARVGNEIIIAGEVIASVNGFLARNGVDPNHPEVREQKQEYVKARLKQLIETRMLVNEAKQKIPPEGYKKALEKFDEEFYKEIAPKMAEERKLPDVKALEEQLRRDGTTLDREKNNFAETVLAQAWVSQNVKVSEDVTHGDMLAHYQSHGAAFDRPAEARWEQISLRFDAFRSKAEAYAALAQIGNQIIDGAPFADVARQASHGSTASKGGAQSWTKKGSLASKPLDEALFTLPVGTLSPIIEDDKGFHIIRVVERHDAYRVPFTEAQVDIRKQIAALRAEEAKKAFLAELKSKTKVWTIYDDESTTAELSPPSDDRYRR